MRDENGPGLKLWYDRPANQFTEALPVGNGRLGAMVFGGIRKERMRYPQHLVDRLGWFQDMKLGVIFHWGIYSQWDCCDSWS